MSTRSAPAGERGGNPIISVDEVSCGYFYKGRRIPALNEMSFDIREGDFAGLFGVNGAGKTTITKILTGLLRPSSGTVTVSGHDVSDGHQAKEMLGYVSQQGSLLAGMTVREELQFQGRSFGLSSAAAKLAAGDIAPLLGVQDLLPRPTQSLSGGQRRRVEIALAIVHRPKILIMDEPTLGLDPQTREGLWETIRFLHDDLGTTILMTTHYLDEAAGLLDQVVVIDHGRVAAEGSPTELIRSHSKGQLSVILSSPTELVKAQGIVKKVADVEPQVDGHELLLASARPEEDAVAVLQLLRDAGIEVQSMWTRPAALSEAFFSITGRKILA